MMAGVVLDTSVWIDSLRRGSETLQLRWLHPDRPIWLSAVVLAELYAGARHDRKPIEKLEHDFRSVRRLIVPDAVAWSRSGRVMAELRDKYDFNSTGACRIMNDVLIAASAISKGLTVLSYNERDFTRIGEFLPVQWAKP